MDSGVRERQLKLRQDKINWLKKHAESRVKLFEDVYACSVSPRHAIKAFCFECVGDSSTEVKACQAMSCPLWEYRPWVGDSLAPWRKSKDDS